MGGGLNINPKTSDFRNIEQEEMGDCLDEELGNEYEEGDELGSDISDSEINQYKEAVHKLLKFRTYKIRSPNGDLRCPFCVGVEKQGYNRLLEHAIRVAEGPAESGKQRANHFAMAKYLVINLAAEEKEKCQWVLSNNQMAEKLREAEENYRGLLEKLKENEVALTNLEDLHQRSVFKERQSNNELEQVRIELIKKDLSNNEMAEKLKKAEENYGGVVKRLESSHTALAEKNSILEAELAEAKEDATSTVAKLREVEKTCLQLQQNLQSIEEKLSNLEDEMHQKTLNESPTPPESIVPSPGGVSESHITNSAIEKQQGNLEILSRCIKDNLGFKDGKPMAARVIYKCLLYWHAFESERTAIFDFIIDRINDVLKEGDENATLPYWLSNTSALVCLLQKKLRWNGFLTAGSQRSMGLPGSIEGPKSSFEYYGLDDNLSHMEAKYPAILFKQQLSNCVGKIFGLIRDNLKKKISPLLGECIQAPKIFRVYGRKSSSGWDSIIKFLDLLMCRLRGNHVPSFFIRKLTTQVFSFINTQLFNSLLLRRECCTFSNGEYVKSGLAELEKWITNTTEEFAGTSWHELNYIRQAVGFLVRHQKRKISLEEIRQDLCPKLTARQIYRISTMYWDDKYGTQGVSNEVVSQMREMVNKNSCNLSSSNSFLLDEDLSIPFSSEDVYMAIPATDPSDIELPKFFS